MTECTNSNPRDACDGECRCDHCLANGGEAFEHPTSTRLRMLETQMRSLGDQVAFFSNAYSKLKREWEQRWERRWEP